MRPSALISSSFSLGAALALSLSGSADAALIVYEPFNYASDSGADLNGDGKFDVNGSNGGTGFAGAWLEESPGGPAEHSFDYIQSGSMLPPTNWSNLSTSGNSLRSIISSAAIETTVWRPLAPIDISVTRTIWMSFLVSRVSGADSIGSHYFALTLSPTTTYENNSNLLQVGDLTTSESASGRNYVLYGNNTVGDTGIEMVGTGTITPVPAFLLVKMVFNPAGNDRFELFVSPTPGSEPTVPNAILEGLDLPQLNFIGFRSGVSATRQWSLDEIRIGDTYTDVTPTIPEPATALMGLVGAAGLGFRRRRR